MINLPEKQWRKILEFLKNEPGVNVGKETVCRLFVEAVLWIVRRGAQWRMLPENYGRWNSVLQTIQELV